MTAKNAADSLKEMEARLHESEERFRQIVETIHDVFWVTDPDKNTMLYISPAYEVIWGRSCQELYARPKSWLEAIHPDDRDRVLDAAFKKQAAGLYNESYRIVRPDGSLRWIHDRAFPVYDASGHVSRVLGLAQDIAERHQLEFRLQEAQKMEAIGRLAGGIAHDFNNIMTAILGYCDMAKSELDRSQVLKEDILEIEQAARRAADMTGRLLAFGRKQTLMPVVLEINKQIKEILGLIRPLLEEDIELEFHPGPGLWSVLMDKNQLEQVLLNLAINARDSMTYGGTLKIQTSNQEVKGNCADPGLEPGYYVKISVEDSGAGMDQETLRHIFEPYFTTKSGRATGLGLATVYGIVKQSGGHVAGRSELGKGSTFEVFLPGIPGRRQAKTLPSLPAREPERDATVLLVEDERQVRQLARRFLNSQGYQVLEASCAEEALPMARSHAGSIELLLTDVIMPGLRGTALAKQLKASRPDIKLIFMSGYSEELESELKESGGMFLKKPFGYAELIAMVGEALSQTPPGA